MKYLIAITGFPGSGKSHLAQDLHKNLNITWIDYDEIAEPLIDNLLKKRMISQYTEGASLIKESIYKVLLDVSFKVLKTQDQIIISAPFTKIRKSKKDFFSKYKKNISVPISVIEIYIKINELSLKKRIINRKSHRDIDKINNWNEFQIQLKDYLAVWDPDITILYEQNYQNLEYMSIIEKLKQIINISI